MNTATDEQLYDAFERTRLASASAIDNFPSIPTIFRTWALTSGFPILNVNYSRAERIVKISQEQFVPLINETEASEFFILYNFVASHHMADVNRWNPEKSQWHWIHTESEKVHNVSDAEWMIFNLQQTGMNAFCTTINCML
jgi:hypothetical protein